MLIGAGRLGTAVSSFISRDTNGYKLIAAFDVNPALEGKEISGVTIRPLSELESFCATHKPVVAVLCVPRQIAMDLSDELVRLGIQGFWNCFRRGVPQRLPRHGCRILWYTPIFMLFFTLF